MPIIINHGEVSVVNRAYDEAQCTTPDYSTDPVEVDRAFKSLCKLYPFAKGLKKDIQSIVCVKPSINFGDDSRHSVNSQIFEPLPNHFFVLPGKMTEAPYVADEVLHRIYERLDFSQITPRPIDIFQVSSSSETKFQLNQRP